jgi:uncharacterized surface protein with fasciclin (FAS1) repeats
MKRSATWPPPPEEDAGTEDTMRHVRIPLALSLAAALVACGDSSDTTPDAPAPNIVGLAQATPDLSILVEAVVAADLAGTLADPSASFTVFAPTNAAFAALLTELGVTKEQLLANKPLLTAVLKYHVLGARVTKAQIPLGRAVEPLEGGFFKIEAKGADVVITDGRNREAKIVATDIYGQNGVVHLIDRVILPADKNIVELAQSLPDFSILVEAVVAADLAGVLSGSGPFTVFAPTNAAFAALLGELGISKEALLANTDLLTAVLTYHVLPARALAAEVVPGDQPNTVQGQKFSISGEFVITDGRERTANIAATDVFASNGVIHVIDRVILPAE